MENFNYISIFSDNTKSNMDKSICMIVLWAASCSTVYLLPYDDNSHLLKKRSYDAYCHRCMSSEYDWLSCFMCSSSSEHTKRAETNAFIFPEEERVHNRKRGSLFKCSCCMRTADVRCCAACDNSYDRR